MLNKYPHSPVPSDSRLWPGELPFTAFGQFGPGNLDLRVFDQDVWWVDRDGNPHLLHEMSTDYLENVTLFLRSNAAEYHHATVVRAAVQEEGDALLGLPPLPSLNAARVNAEEPLQWVESTPLMVRIRTILANRH